MPLNKSRSDAAFRSNVSELRRSGRPRDQSLAIAYRIRRGKADGGEVSDDPFERAAYRVRQGARPEGGRQEGALSAALSDPAFLFNASPFGITRDALSAANQGDYGRALATASPLAVPFAGPALRGAGALLRAAPRTAGTGAAALGVGLPTTTDTAQTAEPSSSEWWRTPREGAPAVPRFEEPTLSPEEEQRYIAPQIQGFSQLGPKAKLEATARRDAMQKSLLQDRERALTEKIARARADWEMANQQTQAAHEAEQARLDQRDLEYKGANQSFREAHPNLTLGLPAAGAAIAGLIPYGGRMLTRGVNNEIGGQLSSAVARARASLGADAATRAAARGEMKAGLGPGGIGRMKDESLTPGGVTGSLGVGALGSGEASLIPYEIDMATLPEGSHGRQEAEDYKNWLQRGGFGSLGGVLGASYGLKAPLMRSKAVPPVSEMEGLLAGLRSPAARTAQKIKTSRRRKPSDDENVIPLREGMASGGSVPFFARQGASNLAHSGMIHSPTSGRSDKLPLGVKGNSFVLPADTVSSIGGGNSMAGAHALDRMFKSAPYGAAMPGMNLKTKAIRQKFADGGSPDAPVTDIMASGGEYVLSPEQVASVGSGDIDRGHDILDSFVKHIRKRTVKVLRKLKGPKAS